MRKRRATKQAQLGLTPLEPQVGLHTFRLQKKVCSAGEPSCPNERAGKPKDVFPPTWCFLGNSGNWGAVISFWNDMVLCCFEHKSRHATESRSGPTHISIQKPPKLLLPKGNCILLSAVMQMGFTFHHYQTANLKCVCLAISEFITKTGCG